MSIYKRKEGEEQPYWPFGPFKVRLPIVHYKLESAEFVQGLVMVVVALSMIPLLEQHLGVPYEVALAMIFIGSGVGNLLPALLGSPLVPGWITPAIPIVVLFLGDFEPGAEAIQALVALHIIVFLIFLILGITKLGSKLANTIPNSLKGGIIIGAGIAALLGEIQPGGRVLDTPISLIIGGLLTAYFMFSLSFKELRKKHKIAAIISNYGMVPALIIAIIIGWFISEYPRPNIEWGITLPDFAQMWSYLPFNVGFPAIDVLVLAIPTAVISYVIAYGDIVVGNTLIERSNEVRKDEKIDYNVDRLHIITAIRNLSHAFFAPYVGQAGPIWTAITATVAERYNFGRKAMDSIYGGAGTFHLACTLALFILPITTFFQPFLPLALSLTLLVTGYICIQLGIEQLDNSVERGVAGITAVVLAAHGAAYGLIVGFLLYILVERTFKKREKQEELEKQDPA